MASKSDFTSEEWQKIMSAPQMAALYVAVASPSGPMGIVSELMAVSKRMAEATKGSSGNALVDALAADIQEMVKTRQPMKAPEMSKDAKQLKPQLLQAMGDLNALLAEKAPEDADGFKQWVYQAAQASAEAAKEGGFLGIGGKKVSEEESVALDEIAEALGIFAF